MSEHLKTRGPTVRDEQLIDVYRARPDVSSPWTVISDQVMGGVSSAALQQDNRHSSPCACLTGRTRLDNNGGFVQMKLEIEPSWLNADYRGLFVELCGEEHDYNLHVKTNQLIKPWQSFRCTLPVEPQWTRFIVPYEQLRAHRTSAELQPADIRSVAVVAIGAEFDVDVCVRRFGFFL
ncbi:MAG: CIA30 family protein [Marinobacter sp.]|uniref:CIA30 family protein n=1 Tax=Marinobacter sp. TaxID=50741 RepID=UPI001B426065|nr:CIA30 family protein [Marinobacter sp.]MBQ0815569.1 CIA30 family protein [Marinobacter sp.]|tara:strand:+ start:802 stop:1335 length:534 start_codon:yes stop_codon:yes gene_type:complete